MNVYYNDIDPYCCKVLQKNIERGYLPQGDVDGRDIREVRAEQLVGYQHIHLFAGIGGFVLGMQRAGYPRHLRTLTGGFPCTDISNAGLLAGITGEQSGLWKEQYRLIQDSIDCGCRFDYILIENVAALVGRGLDTVLIDLAKVWYDAEWTTLRASDFGAPHQRERVFIVAYPRSKRPSSIRDRLSTWTNDTTSTSGTEELAYTDNERCEEQHVTPFSEGQGRYGWRDDTLRTQRQPKSILGRGTYGLSSGMDEHRWPAGLGQPQYDHEPPRVLSGRQAHRVARLKALGNAIVPQCAEYIASCIVAYEHAKEVAA